MNQMAVKSFRVDAAPAYVQFDAVDGQGEVLLEAQNDVPGSYKIRMKAGQFSHSGTPTGPGKFELELKMGTSLKGEVIATEPEVTPDGLNSPPEIVFILRAK